MVDAAYVCWAMDRDAAAVTRSDVHAVFAAPDAPWVKVCALCKIVCGWCMLAFGVCLTVE